MPADVEPAQWNAYCPDCAWGETHDNEDDAEQAADEHNVEQHFEEGKSND